MTFAKGRKGRKEETTMYNECLGLSLADETNRINITVETAY